ncbi:unnamed protein product [Cylicocyclus nassatus]|uniref:Uncharacterized protein n=1 Tax=Cylicocyclus nassatus TaxID=53992 RepID=A0AA36HDQ3_CYLNA|nr:unnamed protein product [Cylicocyclus nassatus]
MSPVTLISILSVVLETTLALKCYKENTENYARPRNQIECLKNVKFCSKLSIRNSADKWLNYYGCDNTLCKDSGCQKDSKGTVTCCCNKDLCNEGSKTPLFSLVLMCILLLLFR